MEGAGILRAVLPLKHCSGRRGEAQSEVASTQDTRQMMVGLSRITGGKRRGRVLQSGAEFGHQGPHREQATEATR